LRFSVQLDNIGLLGEAINSDCNSVRFGSEFCEYKLTDLDRLERICESVHGKGKKFSYVTPRVSNKGIRKLRKHLKLLNGKENVDIVVNDLGVLNIMKHYQNLRPCLGRLLLRVPARSPYVGTIMSARELLARRWFKRLFSSINITYRLTMEFFQRNGVKSIDIDWIPSIFSCLDSLTGYGFEVSIHLHLVPVTFARRCHTARFLGEKNPEKCSKPCFENAFLLKNDALGLKSFLHGNAVFSHKRPTRKDIRKLQKMRDKIECVLSTNPITTSITNSEQKINDFIHSMGD